MNDRETHFDCNLGRLLRASCGPETAVRPAARERLRRELVAMLQRHVQPAEFPVAALGFLTVALSLLFAAWGASAWTGVARSVGWGPAGPILALVLVNLVGIPVASLVVVLRRRYA